MSNFEDVKTFMKTFGQIIRTKPQFPDEKTMRLRYDLIKEELSELEQAKETGNINTYHFNSLRSILEKTATFFGLDDFSKCLSGFKDDALYERGLNLLSHGKYSIYEPVEMGDDNKELFKQILDAFLVKYKFNLPELLKK